MRKTGLLFFILVLAPAALPAQAVYWGNPQAVISPARFNQCDYSDNLGVVMWQEFVPAGPDAGQVYLSLRRSTDGFNWENSIRCIGPYPYRGKQFRNYSMAVDAASRIWVAAATDERVVTVYVSHDRGVTFGEAARLPAAAIVVVPVISVSARNEPLLLVSYLLENEQGISSSRSADGRTWTPFADFLQANESLLQPSLPFHVVFRNRDYLVFQAKRTRAAEFQLYCKTSANGGASWSGIVPVTEALSGIDGEDTPASGISNQRAFLAGFRGELLLAWERNTPSRSPQAYFMKLDGAGAPLKGARERKISVSAAVAANPQLIVYQDRLYHLWFENSASSQDQIMFLAHEDNPADMIIRNLSAAVPGGSTFPQAVVLKGSLSLFWQNQAGGTDKLFYLGPDRSVNPPVLSALNFTASGYGRLPRLQVGWKVPADSSGVRETRILLSRQPAADYKTAPAKPVSAGIDSYQETFPISGEGTFYILAYAVDIAGNVSEPGRIAYTRDTTPPGPVRFVSPERDADGFLASNTFAIAWTPADPGETSGFAASLKLMQADFSSTTVSTGEYPEPGEVITQTAAATDFKNLKNGVYAFSVSAFDKAGNRGLSETFVFRLNHWLADTYITTVQGVRNDSGAIDITILGGGFAENGSVDTVILDRDGVKPYDYVYAAADQKFTVSGDRVISGLELKDVDEGLYQVGVRHPVRGLRFSGPEVIRIDAAGIVRYGPYGRAEPPPLAFVSRYFLSLSFTDIMLWLLVLTLSVVFAVSVKRVAALAREAASLRSDVGALFAGGALTMAETRKKIITLRKRGLGLRIKFTLLISLLALLIVVIVSVPISISMIQVQQTMLADSLFKEVNIVLSGIVRNSKDYLLGRRSRVLVRETLERQYSLLPNEARHAAVTGPRFINPKTGELDLTENGQPDMKSLERVWAAVGANVDRFITVTGDATAVLGSEFKDEVTARLPDLANQINARARERAGAIGAELDRKRAEYDRVQLRGDAAATALRDRMRTEIENLETQLNAELETIGDTIGSVPEFNPEKLDLSVGEYVFYKPIVARLNGSDQYLWGLGRLAVSTDNINGRIRLSRDALIVQTGIIALIALALGITGALVLASIIIFPLRRLSQGVAVIRDTQDKSLLKDHLIRVNTHDELGELTDTVNQMIQGLVKAAVANKELVIGKEVQKMFIPLETDAAGRKRSTGAAGNQFVDLFGYYEGAKGVSGDYFDFKKLDDRYYAIIKCDVAGKGVSASLIMVEVATIFLNYFRDWTFKKNGLAIDALVYRINDMIEERGFKGRFASLNLCLFDTKNGIGHFCNAGDNKMYVHRSAGMNIETIVLPNAPAAGVFPSDLVLAQSGFKQQAVSLAPGDTLYLFTDGIEEAKRTLRDGEYNPIICREPGLKDGENHGGTHNQGMGSEELGIERFQQITEALFGRRRFALVKYHNPVADEELVFDFTDCAGTTEEAVLAVIAVEKVFRLYPHASAGAEEPVRVDRKIDAFLERCFLQYREYFSRRTENPDDPDYYYYSGLREDEQYDDLTILAIRRK